MSLNWDISKVKDWKTKKKSKRNRAVLEALIWATMGIGIRKITKKNLIKFYARLVAWEHIRGAFLYTKSGKPAYITFDELQTWIGLETNANEFSAAKLENYLMYGA